MAKVHIVIPISKNVDVVDYLSDAVAHEESGGINRVVAGEDEIRPTGAPGSNAEGVVEAQITAACWAALKRGT
jgi:hypothetical protein